MEAVNMLLVGCGMMGARHMRGLAELERTVPGTVRLAAVCDRREALAQQVAEEAAELFGQRPAVYGDLEAVLGAGIAQAVDVVTEPRSHDALVAALFEAGLDVICEKPLGLTVTRAWAMVEAARRSDRLLATAENNRHDPMGRLARACLEAGLIGRPDFVLQQNFNPAASICGTAWRHRRVNGGVLLDVGVHQAYMLEVLLGPVETVSARTQTVLPIRCGREYDGTEVTVEVDAEDCFTATLQFASGAQGQWTVHFASAGETLFQRKVFGSEGSLNLPGDRSGQPLELMRGGERLRGEELLPLLPDYHLPEIETRLFGDRPASYSMEYPQTDRKLIAAEMGAFIEAIRTGGSPEADGEAGLRSIAVLYAALESGFSGQPVAVQDVVDGSVHEYQDTVEAAR